MTINKHLQAPMFIVNNIHKIDTVGQKQSRGPTSALNVKSAPLTFQLLYRSHHQNKGTKILVKVLLTFRTPLENNASSNSVYN